MKKNILKKLALSALASLALVLGFSSCADAEGLHDQNALLVTFVFTGFTDSNGSALSGSYAIPGNFNDWDNTQAFVTLKDGEGTSLPLSVTASNIQFSLVPVNEWTHPWYVKGEQEGNDAQNEDNKAYNFFYDGLNLDAGAVTLVIDISSGLATPALQ